MELVQKVKVKDRDTPVPIGAQYDDEGNEIKTTYARTGATTGAQKIHGFIPYSVSGSPEVVALSDNFPTMQSYVSFGASNDYLIRFNTTIKETIPVKTIPSVDAIFRVVDDDATSTGDKYAYFGVWLELNGSPISSIITHTAEKDNSLGTVSPRVKDKKNYYLIFNIIADKFSGNSIAKNDVISLCINSDTTESTLDRPRIYNFITVDNSVYRSYITFNLADASMSQIPQNEDFLYGHAERRSSDGQFVPYGKDIRYMLAKNGARLPYAVLLSNGLGHYLIPDPESVSENSSEITNVRYVNRQIAKALDKTACADVTKYGADPTGDSDSTASIQAAEAALAANGGGDLYFPAGHYKISNTISLHSNTTVVGDGEQTSWICPDLSVMGVTSTASHNLPIPCFKQSGASAHNITFRLIGMDCLKFNDSTKSSTILFCADESVDYFTAENVYAIAQYSMFKFDHGSNYKFTNLSCDCSGKTSPIPSENMLSFAENNNIVIDGLLCKNTVEIVDFSGCTNCVVNNVVGTSDLGDENEAFDIGGSKNITISNAVIDGFGEGAKLKQEGSMIITEKIVISNCIFTNYSIAGIEFLTNYSTSRYVIRDVLISDCEFDNTANASSTANAIYNIRNTNNYGVDGLIVNNCIFKNNNYAIDLKQFHNVKITNNIFKSNSKYGTVALETRSDILDATKNGQVVIADNSFFETQSTQCVYCINVEDVTVSGNKMVFAGSGIRGSAIYMLDCYRENICNNDIANFSYGVRRVTSLPSRVNQIANLVITKNTIKNTSSPIYVAYNLTGGDAVLTVYGITVTDNYISNSTGSGISMASSGWTGNVDYMFVAHNLMIGVRYKTNYTGQFSTLGPNCKDINNVKVTL